MSRCVAERAAADAKDGKMMPNRRVDDGTDSRSTTWCTGVVERLYAYLSYTAPRGSHAGIHAQALFGVVESPSHNDTDEREVILLTFHVAVHQIREQVEPGQTRGAGSSR